MRLFSEFAPPPAQSCNATAAFDLYVREQLGRITYQAVDDIADGIRLISTIEL